MTIPLYRFGRPRPLYMAMIVLLGLLLIVLSVLTLWGAWVMASLFKFEFPGLIIGSTILLCCILFNIIVVRYGMHEFLHADYTKRLDNITPQGYLFDVEYPWYFRRAHRLHKFGWHRSQLNDQVWRYKCYVSHKV